MPSNDLPSLWGAAAAGRIVAVIPRLLAGDAASRGQSAVTVA
jgi:hypothetical protein